MSLHPLIAHRNPDDVVAYRKRTAITAAAFLHDVDRVATALPPGDHVLNACTDRYHFTVGLAAALVAGRTSLLPADLATETLHRLREFRSDVFCLTDTDTRLPGLPRVDYREALAQGAATLSAGTRAFTVPEIAGERAVAWLFTSGSTGTPVPHLKTWGSLVRNVGIEAERLGLRSGSGAIVATVPPQHAYGLESSVLVALQGAVAFSAARPFYPVDICMALSDVPRPRLLVSTPFHLRLLLDAGVDVPALDLIVSATAPLSQPLVREIESRLDAPLVEIFGSTDTGQIASRRPSASLSWHLFTGVRLVPEADRTWASGGHVGAPVVLHDVVEAEGDEHFLLLGRGADLVNIAGKRSSLAYLTHQLCAIPGVVDGAYVMPDDATSGGVTRLAAVAVAPGLTAIALREALRQRVDPLFLPRPLVLVDALPRNDTGKIPREALLRLLARRRSPGETPT